MMHRPVAVFVAILANLAAQDAAACICRGIEPLFPLDGATGVSIDANLFFVARCDDARLFVVDSEGSAVEGAFSAFGAGSLCRFVPGALWSASATYAFGELRFPPEEVAIAEQLAAGLFYPTTTFTTGSALGGQNGPVPTAELVNVSGRSGRSDCDARGFSVTASFDVDSELPVVVVDVDGAGGTSPFEEGSVFRTTRIDHDGPDSRIFLGNSECAIPWDVPFGGVSQIRFGAVDGNYFSGWSSSIAVAAPAAPTLQEGNSAPELDENPPPSASCASQPAVALGVMLLFGRRRRRSAI
jgi:MYXO-CTERM domain-containing protein